jgi:SAM-dependent methyltransferase
MTTRGLDHPDRKTEIERRIRSKPFLKQIYRDVYRRYEQCLKRCPTEGKAIELGSGAGFLREVLPEVETTDVLPYPGLDHVVDACALPYEDASLRAILMFDVFHHIPDVGRFLQEAVRCLLPGGRILIVDQNLGWISEPILKYVHHEPFHPEASTWSFETTGPLSGANGALAWIVFERDAERFRAEFPLLQCDRHEAHTPLAYWLSGGLKAWSLVPGWSYSLVKRVDQFLVRLSPRFASFVDIELLRRDA